jgi:hypothetical protein
MKSTQTILKKVSTTASILTLCFTLAQPMRSEAGLSLIAPVSVGGILVGAAVLGTGMGGFVLSDKIKKRSSRNGLKAMSFVAMLIGFIILDDNRVQPILNDIDMNLLNGDMKKILVDNNISDEDIILYNNERVQYRGVIETVMNDSSFKNLNSEQKVSALFDASKDAGISTSTIKVAGLLESIAQLAN